MNRVTRFYRRGPVLWLAILLALLISAAAGYAVLPTISLNSPTSFPVDI